MVIFDTKNKTKNTLGTLYLSVSDIDYLIKKYGKSILPKKIEKIIKEYFNDEDYYSNDPCDCSYAFYAIVPINITNKEVEFLKIIKEEIKKGNIFTRKLLTTIPEKIIDSRLDELAIIKKKRELSNEELYMLRSFTLASLIAEVKNDILTILDGWDKDKLYDVCAYKECIDDLKQVGIDSKIYESDYFKLKIKK